MTVLWRPGADDIAGANATHFMAWLRERGVDLDGWDALWRWSVDDLEGFWRAVWDFYEVGEAPAAMLGSRAMPGAEWFVGARLNYAEQILARAPRDRPAVLAVGEVDVAGGDAEGPSPASAGATRAWSRDELAGQVGALSAHLRDLGVAPGDRVAAYLPNIPEALVALLATTAIGAVWSACGPDFGVTSVVDRFGQIEPKVLFAIDGYRFGGKHHDRTDVVAELQARLPTVESTIVVGSPVWDAIVATPQEPEFVQVPADHPLWILFSSGTTGLPKGIVQGHGGIVLEHLKAVGLCLDVGPRDTFFFVSSTSWMAWNLLIGGLLHGATIVLSSASPGWPEVDGAFQTAAQTRATVVGIGSAYVTANMKAGSAPPPLPAMRTVIPTGSPLPPAGWRWLDERYDARIDSICGGTDVCTVFFSGNPLTLVRLGEIGGCALGVKAEAREGEMVVTEPMPSMPLFLWDDPDGTRYRETYFDRFEGVWAQGDWVTFTEHGGVIVSGRSDATLNRGGVRLGSAEICAVVGGFDEVGDSLVVGVERPGGDYLLALFVVGDVDDDLRARIAAALRTQLSPRHVPDRIVAAPLIPRTLTGKKLEIPVKRILQGVPPAHAAAAGAIDHPDALHWFAAWS